MIGIVINRQKKPRFRIESVVSKISQGMVCMRHVPACSGFLQGTIKRGQILAWSFTMMWHCIIFRKLTRWSSVLSTVMCRKANLKWSNRECQMKRNHVRTYSIVDVLRAILYEVLHGKNALRRGKDGGRSYQLLLSLSWSRIAFVFLFFIFKLAC